MSASDVVIVGLGMMTAVGLSAPETAAAVRAGLARFAESSMYGRPFEPFTLAEVPDNGLPGLGEDVMPLPPAAPLDAREIRLLRLVTQPLRECLAYLPPGAPGPGVVLALPSPRLTAAGRPIDPAAFLRALARQVGGTVDVRRSDASQVGRAGGIAALHTAATYVRAGHAPYMVAGGVDTYRSREVLRALDSEQRIKSSTHLDGFIPGEGAAFLLLCARATAHMAGLKPLGALTTAAGAWEDGHLYSEVPYRGDGLARAVAELVAAGALPAPVREVYSSMNGEQHWAKEWGVSLLRNSEAFDPEHGMHHPADCVGDTGAACGPLMAGLAALGIAGGYRRSPCLVYGSSDDGPRAVLAVVAA